MTDKLVTADWVAEHGGDDGVRLVEVDVDTAAYGEGHIEGSVGWNWTTQLQDQTRRDIIAKADLEELLSASGIADGTRVILYGDNNNWFAAYALWLLELYGHENVALMDGGRVKWIADGKPTTTAERSPARTSYSANDPDKGLRALRDEVLAAVGGQSTQLVDVRSPAEFTGEIIAPPGLPETAQRPGHIPARSTCRGRARSTRTARSSPRTSCARCTPRRAWTRARRRSRTAGSASAHRTPGSRCGTSSASATSRTTTARGPSTGR